MWKNKSTWLEIACAIIIGGVCTHIVLGLEKVNPFFTQWLLLPGSDYSYHYLAWEYFKDSDWSWPVGKITGYAYPMENSVMYTDSIPLLAIFFKSLRFLLPADFQYFGIWQFLCYSLNAYFGIVICKKIGFKFFTSLLISFFFAGAVPLVARFGHMALCGQWVLLWSLYIFICRKTWDISKARNQIFLLTFITSLIHPYLFFMIVGLTTATFFQAYKENKLNSTQTLFNCTFPVLLGLFGWYQSGAFLFPGNLSEGLGKFSANLNTFINAHDIGNLGLKLTYLDPGQGEGIGYLGLGLHILLLSALVIWIKNGMIRSQFQINWFFMACCMFFIFALSPKWTWGNHIIIDWKYNDYISRTFRGTGRFIWPLYYYILYWVFYRISLLKFNTSFLNSILIGCLLLQSIDLKPLWARNKFVDHFPGPLAFENEMKAVISKADKVICYPPYSSTVADFADYIYFVDMAQKYDKPISTGYAARFPVKIGQRFRDSLNNLSSYFTLHTQDILLTHVDSLALHQSLIKTNGGESFQFDRYRIYTPHSILQTIKHQVDSNTYLNIKNQIPGSLSDFLKSNKEHLIVGTVQQEAIGNLSQASKDYLSNMGSDVNKIRFGDSWAFVIYKNKIEKEAYAKNQKTSILFEFDDCKHYHKIIQLKSGGNNAGQNFSHIRVNGADHSMKKRGLNILVIDSCAQIKTAANFDSYISDNFYSIK